MFKHLQLLFAGWLLEIQINTLVQGGFESLVRVVRLEDLASSGCDND
jgi:hypothetical protein